MEIKNSEYSIDEKGIILNGRGFPVKPYTIEGIKRTDFVDLEIHQKITRFSTVSVLKRVMGVESYLQLRRDLKKQRRDDRLEAEQARRMHREAVAAQPEWSEFPI